MTVRDAALVTPAAAQPSAAAPTSLAATATTTMAAATQAASVQATVTTVPVDTGAYEIATSADGTRTYVTGDNAVSIIDTSSGSPVVATVALPGGAYDVATSSDGKRAFVTNGRDEVAVIDTSGATPTVATVAVGDGANQIAASADGTRAYVGTVGAVSVIDATDPTHPVVTTIPIPGYADYYASPVAVSADGTRAYLTALGGDQNNGNNTVVWMIDTTDLQHPAVKTIPIDGSTNNLAVATSADGKRAYVTYINFDGDNTVTIIDTTDFNNPQVAQVDAGFGPGSIAVSADGTRAYATGLPSDGEGHAVYLIDTTDFAHPVVTEIPLQVQVANGVQDVAITADGTRAYVTNFVDGTLSIIDTTRHRADGQHGDGRDVPMAGGHQRRRTPHLCFERPRGQRGQYGVDDHYWRVGRFRRWRQQRWRQRRPHRPDRRTSARLSASRTRSPNGSTTSPRHGTWARYSGVPRSCGVSGKSSTG